MDIDELLLEEWKQNVALYIDQDKRGLERIKIFLTVHAALLVVFGLLWKPDLDKLPALALGGVALIAIFLTVINQLMTKRAHAFILLRVIQGMLIEKKIKALKAPTDLWKTSSGIITTFSREHVSFKGQNAKVVELQPLINEVIDMGEDVSNPVIPKGHWRWSMRHLLWLNLLHYALYFLWAGLLVLVGYSCYVDC
jgi:hypothetical protein